VESCPASFNIDEVNPKAQQLRDFCADSAVLEAVAY